MSRQLSIAGCLQCIYAREANLVHALGAAMLPEDGITIKVRRSKYPSTDAAPH